MGIAGLATVLVWPSEKSSKDMAPVKGGFKEFMLSFCPPMKGARDFWLAFVGQTLLIFSYYMILNYQLYILEMYIGQGKQAAAATISVMSIITMIVGLVGSLASGAISDKIGRRKLPVIVASVLLAVGYLLPWVLKSPSSMMMFAGFAGLGYAVYGAVDQALNVDVLPSKKEAGKDLGIINMATTLGQTVGPIVTSALVAAAGYQLVFPVAIAFAIDKWEEFFKGHHFENVVLDTHQYLMMAEIRNHDLSVAAYQKTMTDFGKKIAQVNQYVPVVTGEWSLFNSYTAGVDTNGGINPTQQEFNDAVRLDKEKLQKIYQVLWKTQVDAWNQGIGYIYWTYKLNIDAINEPSWYGWDCWALQRVVDKDWLDPCDI